MWNEQTEEIGFDLNDAINAKDIPRIRSLYRDHPWLTTDYKWDGSNTWLKRPIRDGSIEIVKLLVEMGLSVNTIDWPGTGDTSLLSHAISTGHVEIAEYLLDQGADPNLSRPLISAINLQDSEISFRFVRLLVERGIDVNQLFPLYGDWDNAFTALDWAKSNPEISAYLSEHGARTAAELRGETPSAQSSKTPAQEVIDYFAENVGPVDEKAVIEIVPSGHPVSVHAIPPEGNRKHLTLFTTGLSDLAMKVPAGKEDFAYAELFIELPGNWDYRKLTVKQWNWPILWLRKMAQYPHNNDTWLGGPITIIANNDPPKPLATNAPFTCNLLLAEKSFERTDGVTIRLYRVLPIYTEERDLERREGAPALMRALDRNSVPFVVDLNRPSVVKKS